MILISNSDTRKIDNSNAAEMVSKRVGLILHRDIKYQLPKFRGKLSDDSSAAADSHFPLAYTLQLTCIKSGAIACVQGL